MFHSLGPHGLQPTKLLCPTDFPGKNAGVGCHFLLQGSSPPRDWIHMPCIARWILLPLSDQGSPICQFLVHPPALPGLLAFPLWPLTWPACFPDSLPHVCREIDDKSERPQEVLLFFKCTYKMCMYTYIIYTNRLIAYILFRKLPFLTIYSGHLSILAFKAQPPFHSLIGFIRMFLW